MLSHKYNRTMKQLILTALIASTLSFIIPDGGCENPFNTDEYTYSVSGQFYHCPPVGDCYEITPYQNALLCWAWDR